MTWLVLIGVALNLSTVANAASYVSVVEVPKPAKPLLTDQQRAAYTAAVRKAALLPEAVASKSPRTGAREPDPVSDLEKAQAKFDKSIADLNAGNPLSPDFNPAKANAATAKLPSFLRSPAAQKYIKVTQNPEFAERVERISQNPVSRDLAYYEIGLLLAVLIWRTWRGLKAKTLLGRIWIQLYTSAGFVALGFFALPCLLLGDDYTALLQLIWASLKT